MRPGSSSSVSALARMTRGRDVAGGRLRHLPSFGSDQRHEANVGQILALELPLRLAGDPDQLLGTLVVPDRNHEPATFGQLVLERFRHARRAGRYENGIEGRVLQPAARAILVQNVDVAIARITQVGCCLFRQLADPFDRIDLARDLGEHGRGIA
jgi:hypothetical protein